MKTKDYILFESQTIKINEKSLKNIQSTELLFELMLSIVSQSHFSHKKEKHLLECFITYHYDKEKLHEKHFFDILLIHCVRLNHFDLVQYLLDCPSLNPRLSVDSFMGWRKLWSKSSKEQLYLSKSHTSPLDMAVTQANVKMFNYLLKKSNLDVQFRQVSLERFTKELIASITHDEVEKNEILINFSQALFEQTPNKMPEFIGYYNKYVEFYDLKELIKAIRYEHKLLNLDKIIHFAQQISSLVEKKQLEKNMTPSPVKRSKMKI